MDTMNIDLNDMYIEDMDVFAQLDGDDAVVSDDVEATYTDSVNDSVEDFADVDFDEIDEDADEVEVDEEEVEEEIDEEELDEEAEESDETEELDEEDVDFEEYEVTLPNGDTVKLNEAIQGYRSATELEEARTALQEEREAFEEQSKDVKSRLDLAKLEAQKVIEDYEDFDWVTLSREDPQAYVENREFLDRYKARFKEINKEMDRLNELENEEKARSVRVKAQEANEVLTRDIPGWNKEVYTDLMKYGVSIGMTEEMVTSCVDAGMFKALYKAKQLDEGKAVVKAKIKKLGGPKKVVKAAPKSVKQVDGKKAIIKKKIESGMFDESDLGNAFYMLED